MGGHGSSPLRNIPLNPNLRGRCSIRLKGWDYSSPNLYFVTICVQNRGCMFAQIVNNELILNEAGKMIENIWLEMPLKYPGITLDEFVVMPNHIHGILCLNVGAGPRACPSFVYRTAFDKEGRTRGSAPTENRLSLPDVIRQFKTMTSKKYSEGVFQTNFPEFQRRLWQRNYYEHIIRNDKELEQTRKYICDNPAAWPHDEENPEKFT